jgi:hypothetical protein
MIGVAPRQKSSQAAAPAAAARPTKHLVFDLETGNPSEEAIEVAQQFVDAQSNIKDPEKIAENIAKQRDQIRSKAALLDHAPIACMSFVTERERVLFHHTGAPWGKYKVPKSLKGLPDVELRCSKDERGMLLDLRDWLEPRAIVDRGEDGKGYASILGGHNVKGFDLPHLRFAYLRQRLTAPAVLWPEAIRAGVEVFDTMTSFLWDFSSWYRGDKFIRLEVVSALMGLPGYKSKMKGEDVPAYVAAGKFEEVAIYNVLDSLQTYRIFLGQTNQGEDQ